MLIDDVESASELARILEVHTSCRVAGQGRREECTKTTSRPANSIEADRPRVGTSGVHYLKEAALWEDILHMFFPNEPN